MSFRYLSILEGREISDIKEILYSRKHLWVDMVFDEETFREVLLERNVFEDEIRRAVSWYMAYKFQLNEDSIVNRAIEEAVSEGIVIPYPIRWSEWRTHRKSFFKAWNTFTRGFTPLKEIK
jgi:hypothetical protein